MSKEQQLSVVFVYDSEACLSESDDPQDAVLYFYPAWVSEQQKLALCGQLMGTTHFFIASFSCPKVITLRSGQFAIRQCGRYILGVGADHNTYCWSLEKRADSLLGLLKLYHGGIEKIAEICQYDRIILIQKLQEIFDAFVPMAQNFGDTFGQEPNLLLPKSASNVFIEAVQVLEFCQEQPGVLGGAILYDNRVVSTQLSPELTRRLIYSDPFHLRGCVTDPVSTTYELPLGSKLIKVYLNTKEFNSLSQSATTIRDAFTNVHQTRPDRGLSRPFGTSMKKDVSRIFTVLEEKEPFEGFDGSLEDTPSPVTLQPQLQQVRYSNPIDKPSPPTPPLTSTIPSYGRFSLPVGAVTPGTLGKVLHDRRLSICAQFNDDEDTREKEEPEASIFKHSPVKTKSASPININHSEETKQMKQSKSLEEIRPVLKNNGFCGPIFMKGYSFGFPKLNKTDEESENENKIKNKKYHRIFNTITDPMYPVFRDDGLPISKDLFNQYLKQHYCELNSDGKIQKIKTPEKPPVKSQPSTISQPPRPSTILPPPITNNQPPKPALPNLNFEKKLEKPKLLALKSINADNNVGNKKQEIYRRSLSLPLKSLDVNGTDDVDDVLNIRKSFVPEHGRLQDIPMTPLSNILSFSERTGTPGDVPGFPRGAVPATTPGARVTTPAEFRSFLVNENRKKELNDSLNEENLEEGEDLTNAILFVYGHQGMNLILLIDHQGDPATDWDLLETLSESWLGAAPQLESRLRRCIEQTAAGSSDHKEQYCYLCLDPDWDALQRGGKWANNQLSVAKRLHNDLRNKPDMTEIIARCEDQIVYGYQCCRQQVFYQQNAGPKAGLPTPHDLMGNVPLQAKRRLERDHGIILL